MRINLLRGQGHFSFGVRVGYIGAQERMKEGGGKGSQGMWVPLEIRGGRGGGGINVRQCKALAREIRLAQIKGKGTDHFLTTV